MPVYPPPRDVVLVFIAEAADRILRLLARLASPRLRPIEEALGLRFICSEGFNVLLASFLRRKLFDCVDLYLDMSRYLGCTRDCCDWGCCCGSPLAVCNSCFLALARLLGTCCANRLRLASRGID